MAFKFVSNWNKQNSMMKSSRATVHHLRLLSEILALKHANYCQNIFIKLNFQPTIGCILHFILKLHVLCLMEG